MGYSVKHSGEHTCCVVRKESHTDVPRKVSLITLNQGAVGIVVIDWVCKECGHLNTYNGYAHGSFPVARGLAFSVELVYC